MLKNFKGKKRLALKERQIFKRAALISGGGHFLIILLLLFSLPLPKAPPIDMEYIISAEIVTMADVPNIPKTKKEKKSTSKNKTVKKSAPKKDDKNVIKISDPKKENVKKSPKKIKAAPIVLSDNEDAPPPATVVKNKKMVVQEMDEDQEFLKSVKKVISEKKDAEIESAENNSRDYDVRKILSISEVISLRQQLESCWIIPVGAKNAENLIVELKVFMNSDATVKHVEIVDKRRMNKDTFFRTAAESARRAVQNPACSPLNLPRNKYDKWKVMTLIFNPKDIL